MTSPSVPTSPAIPGGPMIPGDPILVGPTVPGGPAVPGSPALRSSTPLASDIADHPTDPEQLRAEIAATRAALGETAEALVAKTDLKARLAGSLRGLRTRFGALIGKVKR